MAGSGTTSLLARTCSPSTVALERLLWLTRVHEHLTAIITSSPIVDKGVAYVGIASKEEGVRGRRATSAARFAVRSSRSMRTGRILWKTYMVPSNNNEGDINLPGFYSGNGVWGSSPVVDTKRGLLYFGTANNFSAPPGVCLTPEETGCEESRPDNHFDSIVAVRLTDGEIAWATRTLRADVLSSQCLCGPDLDFGAAPNLFTTTHPSRGTRSRYSASVKRAAITGRSIQTTVPLCGVPKSAQAGSAVASNSVRRPTASAFTWLKPTRAEGP